VIEPGRPRGLAFPVALAAIAALPPGTPAWLATPALALALAWAPGALAARALQPRGGAARRALLALATSPFLAGAPGALLLALGVAPPLTARIVLAAVAVAALTGVLRPAGQEAERDREGATPWLAAALWTALMAALLVGNRWLAPRSDGWFHAAVTLQMTGANAGHAVPPEDPFFAGIRLLYFWGYHAWATLWLAVVPALSVWVPLVTLNLTSALAVILGVCLLSRRLGADSRGMWAAATVATLGYAPFSWLWIVLRTFTGEVTGVDELRRLLAVGATPPMLVMSTWTLHSSMVFFGDKFLVLTPFAPGLAQFALLLLALLDFIARPAGRESVTLGLAVAAALFTHSVVGWSVALIAGAWWWWALARARGIPALRPVLVALPLVFAAAVVILLPYLAATTLGKERGLAPGFSGRALGTWLLSGMLIVPLGLIRLWNERKRREDALHLLVFAVALSVAGLTIWMPGNNQSKFFNLLFLLLAAPAGLWLADAHGRFSARGRRVLVGALGLAIVPTVLVSLWAFASEHGRYGEPWEHTRPLELEGMAWAASHAPPRTVLVDRRFATDLSVRARRSVLSGGERWEHLWSYPAGAMAARRAAAEELGALAPASPATRELIRGLARPVFVAVRRRWEEEAGAGWEEVLTGDHPGYHLVYRNADIAFFRWEGRWQEEPR
jgi:hypothetical protein